MFAYYSIGMWRSVVFLSRNARLSIDASGLAPKPFHEMPGPSSLPLFGTLLHYRTGGLFRSMQLSFVFFKSNTSSLIFAETYADDVFVRICVGVCLCMYAYRIVPTYESRKLNGEI